MAKFFTKRFVDHLCFILHILERLGMPLDSGGGPHERRYISLYMNEVSIDGSLVDQTEAYHLSVQKGREIIEIFANNSHGVMHGCQTLISLAKIGDFLIPNGDVIDFPRFPYRGMHVDVVRNFHGFDDIIRVLEGLHVFKINKLHLHLTDDEGWRLEIPGIPELTEVCSMNGQGQMKTRQNTTGSRELRLNPPSHPIQTQHL